MGGCMSKFHVVEYDASMKHKQKKEEAPYVKPKDVEDDGNLKTHSASRRSLSNLFKQDEDYEVKKEDIEEKGIIQKNETPNLSIDAVVYEKQKDPKACEIETVIVQDDVKPNASKSCLQKMPEDPSRLETITSSQGSHVETEHLNINEPNPSNSATEVGCVTVEEKGAGTEVCEHEDGNENQVKISDTGITTKDPSSSSGDETLVQNDKNSMNSGTGLPTNEVKKTMSDVEGNHSDSNIQTSADNNINIFQNSSAKVGVDDDHHKSDVEGKVLVASLPISENHALNISAETTCKSKVEFPTDGSNCATNNVKVGSLGSTVPSNENSAAKADIENEPIVGHNLSSSNAQDAESNVEDHHKNSVFGSIEDTSLESTGAARNQSDRARSVDDVAKEISNITEHTHSMTVDNHNSSDINETEEEKTETKEASIVQSKDSTISTSISTSPALEMSAIPLKDCQDETEKEPLKPSKFAGKDDEKIENKETKELDGKTEKFTVSNENLATKAGGKKTDGDHNSNSATQSDELGNDIHSSMMNQEELTKRNLPILDSASKENGEEASTNLEMKLTGSDKTFNREKAEFAPVNDNLPVKDDLSSKKPADNFEREVKSSETSKNNEHLQ